jgi:hypothetical protein
MLPGRYGLQTLIASGFQATQPVPAFLKLQRFKRLKPVPDQKNMWTFWK